MSREIIPLNENLIILPVVKKNEEDGVFLGEEQNYTCGTGIVVAVAEDCSGKVKINDEVVYRFLGQSDFNYNGDKVHIVKESNIDAILN